MQAWRLAARNLRRNARRSFATGIAIAFGFAGLVIVGGYILRVDRYLATSAVYLAHNGHVAIYKREGIDRAATQPRRYSLSAKEQAEVARVLSADPNVALSSRYLQGMGLIGNGCRAVPFLLQGVEPNTDRYVRSHPAVLEHLPELSKPIRGVGIGDAGAGAVSLTAVLARRLGKPRVKGELSKAPSGSMIDCEASDVSERIASTPSVQLLGAGFDGAFNAVEATLTGIHTTGIADTEDSSVVTSLSVAQALFDTDSVTYIGVFLRDAGDVESYARDLQRRLVGQGIAASVHPFTEERVSPYYVGSHAFLIVFALFVGGIIMSVIVLSIIGSSTMTVIERSREIGSLRSIGFRRGAVRALFLRETIALSAISLAAGLFLSLSTCAVVNALNFRYSPPGVSGDIQFRLHPDLTLCVTTTVLVFVFAIIGTFVAVRARVSMKVAELNAAVSA